ncbi:MAG: glycosyltransferase family 2 protein, partial [bacterium]|nr:glycosyltransferase family 2 protein [bacterium]
MMSARDDFKRRRTGGSYIVNQVAIMKPISLSIVVPVYNEEHTVEELHRRIVAAAEKVSDSFEIIFVNNRSSDQTERIARRLRPLRLIMLQKNSGITAAIDTGIAAARGETIVLLDADLQNDPAEIPLLLEKMREGYDVVIGYRTNRRDPIHRMLFSRFANFCARRVLGLPIHDFGCGLKAYRSKFIKHFRLLGETHVFLAAVAKERGARIGEIPVSFHPRRAGASKIRIWNMVKGAFDLLSVAFFVRYFSRP